MSAAKHTEGPWLAEDYSEDGVGPKMLAALQMIVEADGMRPGHVAYLSRADIVAIAKDAIAVTEGRP